MDVPEDGPEPVNQQHQKHSPATPTTTTNNKPSSPSIPQHLSEFYKVGSWPARGGGTTSSQQQTNSYVNDTRRQSFMSDAGSTIGTDFRQVAEQHPDIPALLTHSEIVRTSKAYEQLVQASLKYRKTIEDCAAAAAEMGNALDACANCPGSVEGLESAAGLYLLIANQQSVLARSMYNAFEQPVESLVGQFSKSAKEREAQFRINLRSKSKALQEHETQIRRMSKRVHRTTRDLGSYRNSLLDLTGKIDDIDRLKYAHFQDAFRLANDTSRDVFSCVASTVRAHLEISEGLARKGWSGGGLEEIVAAGSDPFVLPEEDEEEHSKAKSSNRQFDRTAPIGEPCPSSSGEHNENNILNYNTSNGNEHSPNTSNLFSVLPNRSILPLRHDGSDDEEEHVDTREHIKDTNQEREDMDNNQNGESTEHQEDPSHSQEDSSHYHEDEHETSNNSVDTDKHNYS